MTGGFLTPTQFWAQHEEEFLALQSQPIGITSEDRFLDVPPPPPSPAAPADPKKPITAPGNHF